MQKIEHENLSEEIFKLIELAKVSQVNAYAPYSNYLVGASVLDERGKMFGGCNVENAAYTGTHAEANAIGSMVADGGKKVVAMVCITKDGGSSCGDCRQRTWEFAKGNKELPIYLVDGAGEVQQTTIGELLPFAFEL